MNGDQFDRVEEVFDGALGVQPQERDAFLAETTRAPRSTPSAFHCRYLSPNRTTTTSAWLMRLRVRMALIPAHFAGR